MQVIAGFAKGRKLKRPKSILVRPTQDRVRQAIFNIIRNKIDESFVLDLFAGTGAFGIEAISQGARGAIFVDNNIEAIRCMKHNVSVLGDLSAYTKVIKQDAMKAISRFGSKCISFDIIFLDPPYYKSGFKRKNSRVSQKAKFSLTRISLIKINGCDILSQHGLVIAEHSDKDELPKHIGKLRMFLQKRYGNTAVSFYKSVSEELSNFGVWTEQQYIPAHLTL